MRRLLLRAIAGIRRRTAGDIRREVKRVGLPQPPVLVHRYYWPRSGEWAEVEQRIREFGEASGVSSEDACRGAERLARILSGRTTP